MLRHTPQRKLGPMPVACRLDLLCRLMALNNCHHFYSSCILGLYLTVTFSKLCVFVIHPPTDRPTGRLYEPSVTRYREVIYFIQPVC